MCIRDSDKRGKLPKWITSHLHEQQLNLSTDMAVAIARQFMRDMAQPYDRAGQMGKSLLDQNSVNAMAAAAGFGPPTIGPPPPKGGGGGGGPMGGAGPMTIG